MQTEPIVVNGAIAPVSIGTNWFTGRATVTVGDRQLTRGPRNTFALPLAGGGTASGRVRVAFWDPFPTIEVNGQRIRTGPPVPRALRVLMAAPIVLLVGGLTGGLIAAFAILGNSRVAAGRMSNGVKGLVMTAVLLVGVLVYVTIAAMVASATGRA